MPVHGRWWKKIQLVELFNLKHEHWMLNHSIQFAACWAFIISHGSRPQLSEIEHYVSRNYISNRSPHVISIVCCRKSEQLNQKHIDSILYLRYALIACFTSWKEWGNEVLYLNLIKLKRKDHAKASRQYHSIYFVFFLFIIVFK